MSEKLLVPDIGEFEKVEVIELLVKLENKKNLIDLVVTMGSDKPRVEFPPTVPVRLEFVRVKWGDKFSKGDI